MWFKRLSEASPLLSALLQENENNLNVAHFIYGHYAFAADLRLHKRYESQAGITVIQCEL